MSELLTIVEAVKEVGFPIVAYLLMFWFSVKIVRENTKAIQGLAVAITGNKSQVQNIPNYQQAEDQYKKP